MGRKLLYLGTPFLLGVAILIPSVNAQNIPEPNCVKENGDPCFGRSSRPSRTPEEIEAIREARRERAEARRKAHEQYRIKKAARDAEKARIKQAKKENQAKEKAAQARQKERQKLEQEAAKREKLAMQHAASAKRHGINAAASPGNAEGSRDQAGKPFDSPGARSTADEVDLRIAEYRRTADRPVPPALANDPKYKKLNERVKKDETKLQDLQKRLEDVRQKRATATGSDKGKLEVAETNVKQEMSNVKSDMAVGIIGMHDMSVSFEEAAASPKPKPGIVVPPKP